MAKGLATGSASTTSVLRLGTLLAIALGVFGLAVGAFLFYASLQNQLAWEQASRAADDRAREVRSGLDAIQATLRDPQVRDLGRGLIVEGVAQSEELRQAVRRRGVANILDLRAFPAAVEDVELGVYPEPDFTVIQMLIEARRSGAATIQVHYPGTANENLAFAQAIEANGAVVGILFLRVPISVATSLLNDPGPLDYLSLVQSQGERRATLRSWGSPVGGRVEQIPLPGSMLRVEWSRSAVLIPVDGNQSIIIAATGLLLLLGGLLVRRRAHLVPVAESAPVVEARPVTTEPAPNEPPPVKQPTIDPAATAAAAATVEQELPDWLLDGDDEEVIEAADSSKQAVSTQPSVALPDLPDPLSELDAERAQDSSPTVEPEVDDAPKPTEAELFEPPSAAADHEALQTADILAQDTLNEEDMVFDFGTMDGSDESFADVEREQDPEESTAPEQSLDPVPELELQSAPKDGPEPAPEPEPEPEAELELKPEPPAKPAPAPEPAPGPAAKEASELTLAATPAAPAAVPAPSRPLMLDPELFRITMLGGVIEAQLDARSATLIGQAIGAEARSRQIDKMVVARDGRLFGAVLLSALSQGLRASGVDVIEIGAVPAPVLGFAAAELTDGSGVMVTGSHHQPNRNGFRIRLAGELLHGQGIQRLLQRIQDQDLVSGAGRIEEQVITERYVERISADIKLQRPIKVVVDCANGIAGSIAPQLLTAIGADVIPLYADVDGNFPNHHPNPADPDNLEDLKLCVRNFQADLGIAYDGAGERLGIIGPDGETVWPDRLLMLLVQDLLARQPGALIVFDSECSSLLSELVQTSGGRSIMVSSAVPQVLEAMRKEQALLGGLMSGNLILAERGNHGDDAIYASARLLELLAADPRPIKEVLAALPQAETSPQFRLALPAAQAEAVVAGLKESAALAEAFVSTVDGVRADFDDGWGLARASRSEDALVLRFEGNKPGALNRIKDLFKAELKALAPDLKLLF